MMDGIRNWDVTKGGHAIFCNQKWVGVCQGEKKMQIRRSELLQKQKRKVREKRIILVNLRSCPG